MKIAVTPADQAVARLDVMLAEQLGEEVDPRVKVIADADLTLQHTDDDLPEGVSDETVYLDNRTGEVVAVSAKHWALKRMEDRDASKVQTPGEARVRERFKAGRLRTAPQRSEGPAPSS